MKKFSVVIVFAFIALILAFVFKKTGLINTLSPEELDAILEITDVETKWVDKYYQPWPPKLVLVPAISFQIRNASEKPLKYVNFNANFRFKDDYENLGDSFLAAIRNIGIAPGEKSEVILLKSNYGVEGKSVNDFETNPGWKTVFVKLFAQSRGSQYITLGEWEISKTIDFEEPEEVGANPEEKKDDRK